MLNGLTEDRPKVISAGKEAAMLTVTTVKHA